MLEREKRASSNISKQLRERLEGYSGTRGEGGGRRGDTRWMSESPSTTSVILPSGNELNIMSSVLVKLARKPVGW